MNLIIDIGNSYTKLAIFDNYDIISTEKVNNDKNELIYSFFSKNSGLDKGIVSITGKSDPEILNFISNNLNLFLILDEHTALPIENLYETKDTLGKDRIAAAVAANHLFPANNLLVIDAGTALTYEFINNKAQYLGGCISPGLSMRFKALNTFTNKLPLVTASEHYNVPASTTHDAIQCGVQSGIIKEIEGTIKEFEGQYSDLKVVFTGGDVVFFEKKVKSRIFVDSNLVLRGLNRILDFNAEKI
ncbi:MAG: type III pantothenate kinase [Bacteroidales bacterium]|nr:type III pantothenate kinase [Bacteroidales bacterium]